MFDHGLAALETADARAEYALLRADDNWTPTISACLADDKAMKDAQKKTLDERLQELLDRPDVIAVSFTENGLIVTRESDDGELVDEKVGL